MNLFEVYTLYEVKPSSAKDVYVYDNQGVKYLDLYGGHAVISIGHSQPHYIKQIKDQLDQSAFYSNAIQNPLQQRLTVVHVGCFQLPFYRTHSSTSNITVPDDDIKEIGLNHILRGFESHFKKAKDKVLLIRTHDLHCHSKFPNVTTIRIWGKNSALPNNSQYKERKEIYPVDAQNVINVNIDYLLSTDYKKFEDEYFTLCENLDINPTPIPVRGYILNYLDRRNNNSNKVIPRTK